MKAWQLEDKTGYCEEQKIVWANTRNEAKLQAGLEGRESYNQALVDVRWIDIRATRLKELDGMKNNELNIMKKLITLGWWFEIGGVRYDAEHPFPEQEGNHDN